MSIDKDRQLAACVECGTVYQRTNEEDDFCPFCSDWGLMSLEDEETESDHLGD